MLFHSVECLLSDVHGRRPARMIWCAYPNAVRTHPNPRTRRYFPEPTMAALLAVAMFLLVVEQRDDMCDMLLGGPPNG
jgi:hypothetical protein